MIPTSIDGTDITGATIDGTDVQEITVDGDVVFSAVPTLPTQNEWETETVVTQAFWNDNWQFGSTDSSDTVDNSFVNNRFGVQNAIDVEVDDSSNDRAFYFTTAYDLTGFNNLAVYGQGRDDNNNINDQELEIRIDNNLEFASSVPGWQEINVDISSYSGNVRIELGYRNDRGSIESGTYSEFFLEV